MHHPPDKEKAPFLASPASNIKEKEGFKNESNIHSDSGNFNPGPLISGIDFETDLGVMNFALTVTGAAHGSYIGIGRKINGRFIRSNLSPSEFLNLLQSTPGLMDDNFWFCCSALNSRQGQKQTDCVCTQSITVDLDYGLTGHKKPSRFSNEAQVLNCLRSLPIKPTLVWNTGHGLQAAFLLAQPVYYDDKKQADKLVEAKAYIYAATHSDDTQSPEHLFRFPCSMNIKPNCEPIRGRVIEL